MQVDSYCDFDGEWDSQTSIMFEEIMMNTMSFSDLDWTLDENEFIFALSDGLNESAIIKSHESLDTLFKNDRFGGVYKPVDFLYPYSEALTGGHFYKAKLILLNDSTLEDCRNNFVCQQGDDRYALVNVSCVDTESMHAVIDDQIKKIELEHSENKDNDNE